jgi:hypothetical protein
MRIIDPQELEAGVFLSAVVEGPRSGEQEDRKAFPVPHCHMPGPSTEVNCRVASLQRDSGILTGETPIDPATGGIPLSFPSGHL